MRRNFACLLVLSAAFLSACDQGEKEEAKAPAPVQSEPSKADDMPVTPPLTDDDKMRVALVHVSADIRDYVMRRAGCNHWGGEPLPEGDDDASAGRRMQIETAIAELNCDGLNNEKAALKTCYADMAETIMVLDAADEWGGGDPMVEFIANLPPQSAPSRVCATN